MLMSNIGALTSKIGVALVDGIERSAMSKVDPKTVPQVMPVPSRRSHKASRLSLPSFCDLAQGFFVDPQLASPGAFGCSASFIQAASGAVSVITLSRTELDIRL